MCCTKIKSPLSAEGLQEYAWDILEPMAPLHKKTHKHAATTAPKSVAGKVISDCDESNSSCDWPRRAQPVLDGGDVSNLPTLCVIDHTTEDHHAGRTYMAK